MPAPEITTRQSGPRRAETGSALVVVLWISALLAVMATGFSTSMRMESRAARNLVENIRVRALADAAVQRGISDLLNATTEKLPLSDGTATSFTFGGGDLSVAIQSERGKADLNKAPEIFLKGVLRQSGMADAAADALGDAIADWRDEDDFRRLNGAEAPEYRSAGLKFEPTNAPFRTVAELEQVIGIDHRTFQRLSPLFTVHSYIAKINPDFAPRQVLAAIPGVNMVEVDALVAAREKNKYNDVDSPLPLLSGVADWISQSPGPVYTIRGSAILPSGARFTREVVVWVPTIGGERYWVLDVRVGSAPDVATEAGK